MGNGQSCLEGFFSSMINFIYIIGSDVMLPSQRFVYLLRQIEWITRKYQENPCVKSFTAGGSWVALPPIHLQRYYPSILKNQLSFLVFECKAACYRMNDIH